MNQYKKSRLIVVLSVLLVLSCSLLYVTQVMQINIPYVTDGVHRSLAAVNHWVSKPVVYLSTKKDSLVGLMSAYEENKELKKTLIQIESQLDENETLKKENESLRQTLGIVKAYPDKTLYSVIVSVRTPATWTDQLIVDLENGHSIRENMIVVANGGVIGVVKEVYETSAKVKLLTNATEFTKIPVKITTASGDVYGILSGYDVDQHTFVVNQLNSAGEIPVDSNVVTSDLGGAMGANLQIGKVKSVKTSNSDLKRELHVTPSADFSNLYAVTIVGETQ